MKNDAMLRLLEREVYSFFFIENHPSGAPFDVSSMVMEECIYALGKVQRNPNPRPIGSN